MKLQILMNQMQTSLIQKGKKYLENKLDELYNIKAKGAQIRSKAKCINEGEKSTKKFWLRKSTSTIKCYQRIKKLMMAI